MFYEFDLTVPAATAKTSPATADALLDKGHVTGVAVVFPPGCAGLVSVVVDRGASQVWPSNPDGAHKGDAVTIAWAEDFPLADHPLILTLRGWSPDARFAHTVTFRFELLALAQAEAAHAAPGILRRLGEAILGRD